MKTANQIQSVPSLKPVLFLPLAVLLYLSALAFHAVAQAVTDQYTTYLTYSGDGTNHVDVVSDAQASPDSLTPAFSVAVPNQQAPRLLNFFNAAVAIPFGSPIRQIEAYWNGTPLPLIDPMGTAGPAPQGWTTVHLVEEPHTYASMIPFFKPLFSVAGAPAGGGILRFDAFDSNYLALGTVSISNLTVVQPPPPIPTSAVAAMAHPRIYLTASRLSAIRARPESDVARQRYEGQLNAFLAAMAGNTNNVLSGSFAEAVDVPESYMPLLALTYQLDKDADTDTAQLVAGAAHILATNLVNQYASRQSLPAAYWFGRDSGYWIREDLKNLMLAYDWNRDGLIHVLAMQ